MKLQLRACIFVAMLAGVGLIIALAIGPTILSWSTQKPPHYIGVFADSSPSNPNSLDELDQLSAMGCNIMYNYAAIDGTPRQVWQYLDHARSRGLKVIIGLNNFYDPGGDATVNQAVKNYASHSAVWGFGIADEKPESPDDSAALLSIVTRRYHTVKALTSKPVMAIAVGATDSSRVERRAFLRSFSPAVDTLAIDNYPVPYVPGTNIEQIMTDGPVNRDTWFVTQAFSWSRYPDTAKQLGYDPVIARAPSADEMTTMARQALNGGASSILFYSYFDIKSDPVQVQNLTKAIRQLRASR